MMNKFMKLSAFAILLEFGLSSGVANAAFTGDYAVSNWTKTLDGGSINTGGAPSFVSLVSKDFDVFSAASNQDFTISAVAESIISFNWNYLTSDIDGSFYDPFYFLLNGSSTKLTVDNSFAPQSGFFSKHVNANDVFGFRANAVDSYKGFAITRISNFDVTAVPEPETYALMLAGLGMVGFMARRRKTNF
jgi:hypothetical protein